MGSGVPPGPKSFRSMVWRFIVLGLGLKASGFRSAAEGSHGGFRVRPGRAYVDMYIDINVYIYR